MFKTGHSEWPIHAIWFMDNKNCISHNFSKLEHLDPPKRRFGPFAVGQRIIVENIEIYITGEISG